MSQVYVGNGSGGGSGSTDLHVSAFIVSLAGTVGTGANYSTITTAMAAAPAGSTIFLMPGTYTESFNWKGNVALVAFGGTEFQGTVQLTGTITVNSAGFFQAVGIYFIANGSTSINFTGGSTGQLFCTDCYFLAENAGTSISFTSSSSTNLVQLYQCSGNILDTSVLFVSTAIGGIATYGCQIANGSSSPSTVSAGSFSDFGSELEIAISSSGTAGIQCYNTVFGIQTQNNTYLRIGGSGTNQIYNCSLTSGSSSCITVSTSAIIANCVLQTSNASVISGVGTVSLGGITFPGTSSNVTATTTNGIVNQLGAPAYKYVATAISYAVKATDSIVGVTDNSAARTITMPNSGMTKGQVFTVKDEAGTAGSANNITVSGNGVNIDGAATFVLTNNFESVNLYWNGTQFYII